MKKLKFNIEIYSWSVILLIIESEKDYDPINKILTNFMVDPDCKDEILSDIKNDARNGGYHLHNNFTRKSIIILHKTDSLEYAEMILSHEKRHLEDAILQTCNIADNEAAAYLAGHITKKILQYQK